MRCHTRVEKKKSPLTKRKLNPSPNQHQLPMNPEDLQKNCTLEVILQF